MLLCTIAVHRQSKLTSHTINTHSSWFYALFYHRCSFLPLVAFLVHYNDAHYGSTLLWQVVVLSDVRYCCEAIHHHQCSINYFLRPLRCVFFCFCLPTLKTIYRTYFSCMLPLFAACLSFHKKETKFMVIFSVVIFFSISCINRKAPPYSSQSIGKSNRLCLLLLDCFCRLWVLHNMKLIIAVSQPIIKPFVTASR